MMLIKMVIIVILLLSRSYLPFSNNSLYSGRLVPGKLAHVMHKIAFSFKRINQLVLRYNNNNNNNAKVIQYLHFICYKLVCKYACFRIRE